MTGRTVTYGIIVGEIQPQKYETHCTQLTVGENIINFPGDITTPTVDLTAAKLIFNSFLLTQNEKLRWYNISNFYLNNTIYRY